MLPGSFRRTLCLLPVLMLFQPPRQVKAQVTRAAVSNDLRIVFPSDNDTLDVHRTRYAGSVRDTTSRVTVNGVPTAVFSSGAFVGLVPLQPGDNLLVFEAVDSTGAVLGDSVHIFRPPPAETLPGEPSRIVEVWPKRDVWVEPGALIQVQLRATPGGSATFEVPKLLNKASLLELPASESGGINGLYRAVFRVPMVASARTAEVRFKFKGADGRSHKARAEGRIQVLDPTLPLVGETVDSTNLFRTAPRGAIWTVLPEGIRLEVVGQTNRSFHVRLGKGHDAFTALENLRLLPRGTAPSHATVSSISGSLVGDWVQLRVNLDRRVAYKIEQDLAPSALEVHFFGAHQGSEWVTYPPGDTTVRRISWRQDTEDVYTLRVELNQHQMWGFDGRYVGSQFWLEIRRSPNFAAVGDSLLRALTIAVDPGHGGDEPGAIGATGLMEKDVNLAYATRVVDLLRKEGATVVQTRTSDTTMTLLERVKIARAANAHLFVWLHNNSIGAATDPMAVRGTSTYYTVPQAMDVAWYVYPRLLGLGLRPFGRIGSTYFVTRQTGMVTFLVEGAFVSNPLDEMLLLDDSFLDKLAAAVVQGIEDFVRRVADSSGAPDGAFSEVASEGERSPE